MTDPIKECVKWLRLATNRHWMYSPWADAIEALQDERDHALKLLDGLKESYDRLDAERDALATQLKGEKLWEERCADLEAQIVAMRDVCEAAYWFSLSGKCETLDEALRKWRKAEWK